METNVWIVLIGAIGTVCASFGVPMLTARNVRLAREGEAKIRKAELDEANKRADLLAERQRELIDGNKVVLAKTELLGARVDVVHAIVNSASTVQKQQTLTIAKTALVTMQMNEVLLKKSGEVMSPESISAMGGMRKLIVDLETEIGARVEQQKISDELDKIKAGYVPPA